VVHKAPSLRNGLCRRKELLQIDSARLTICGEMRVEQLSEGAFFSQVMYFFYGLSTLGSSLPYCPNDRSVRRVSIETESDESKRRAEGCFGRCTSLLRPPSRATPLQKHGTAARCKAMPATDRCVSSVVKPHPNGASQARNAPVQSSARDPCGLDAMLALKPAHRAA
jgi:hypothetical protein